MCKNRRNEEGRKLDRTNERNLWKGKIVKAGKEREKTCEMGKQRREEGR